MNFTFGNITTGVNVTIPRRGGSPLAIAAYGIINGPVTPPPTVDNDEIPLQEPVIVSLRSQYAGISRLGSVEGAASYRLRLSWDQINWTEIPNAPELYEYTFAPDRTKSRTLYAQHRAYDGSGQPLGDWTATGSGKVLQAPPVELIVHPRMKVWRIGDRLADYVSPEGLTYAQMLDPSNVIAHDGAVVTKIEMVTDGLAEDIKSLTQRIDALDLVGFQIRVGYTYNGKSTAYIFETQSSMVKADVWLDVRQAEGTDKINIPDSVPVTSVLPDFVHEINGTVYTTSGVSVAQLRAGPVAVTGASGVTIANVAPGVWATLGVAAGADMITRLGRQFVWVPTYGSDPGPSCKIIVHRGAQQVVGEGLAPEPLIWGFDSRKDWRVIWNDPMHNLGKKWVGPGITYDAPEVMRTPWRDGTKGYGPCPTFVTRTASWSITLMVSERSSGKFATFTLNGTSATQAEAFPGAATIVVTGVGGGTTGAPAGATVVENYLQARAALKANRSTKKQILFNSEEGIEHALNMANGDSYFSSSIPNCYVDSYGPGKATLVLGGGASVRAFYLFPSSMDQDGAIIRNLILKCVPGWDPSTDTGRIGTSAITFSGGGWATFSDLECEGFETSYGGREVSSGGGFIMDNCASRGHRDYALYCAIHHLTRIGITGNLLAQKPDAMMGGLGRTSSPSPNNSAQHFVRYQGYLTMYTRGNDFFPRGGWDAPKGGLPVDQNVRDHSNLLRGISYICENVFEGGWGFFGGGVASPDQTGGGYDYPSNKVLERNLMVGSARTRSGTSAGACTTIRGNLGIKPRVESSPWDSSATNFIYFIRAGGGGEGGVRGDTHIEAWKERSRCHHNTFIHLGDATTDPGGAPQGFPANNPNQHISSDNLYHAPNRPDWGHIVAGMVAVDEGLDPRNPGYKWRYEELPKYPAQPTLLTEFGTPADTIRLWRPDAGTAAATAAGDVLPPFDFDGEWTPGMPNGVGTTVPGTMWAGAVKPAA